MVASSVACSTWLTNDWNGRTDGQTGTTTRPSLWLRLLQPSLAAGTGGRDTSGGSSVVASIICTVLGNGSDSEEECVPTFHSQHLFWDCVVDDPGSLFLSPYAHLLTAGRMQSLLTTTLSKSSNFADVNCQAQWK